MNLTFSAQVTISYLVTFSGNSALNILISPCVSLLPPNIPSFFSCQISQLSFLSSCHLPNWNSISDSSTYSQWSNKGLFWKAVWSLTSSRISASLLQFSSSFSVFSSPFISHHMLFHLVTPHLQHYPLYWCYCPDYNHPEAIEDL